MLAWLRAVVVVCVVGAGLRVYVMCCVYLLVVLCVLLWLCGACLLLVFM